MKRITIAVIAAATLALAACGTQGAPSEPADAPATSTSTTAPAATAEPAEATEEPQDDVATFGQTYTFEDGLKVTVSAPQKFKPSPYAVEGKGVPVKMTVTIVNGTGKPFDPTLVMASASSGETEAEEIFDSEKGLEGSPQTSVRPGKKVTYPIGFSVKDPKDVLVELTPGFEYEPAVFTAK